ncbi:FAD dependent oxidoreductase [Aminobacter aminovorans]|uniref:FAD dependent oxidoreductase n=2 Tax=Aminobacter aminovorans TaxID=83263 RepID=A0A381IL44_AMIAI|nr:FAD dependent oxidoreductase [Aminobacter aminovorans]SUY28637.1 FAD dependent oxidoreductase [Aminobacter aminovorans]
MPFGTLCSNRSTTSPCIRIATPPSWSSYMPGAQPGMLRNVPGCLRAPLGPLANKPSYLPRALPWFMRWLKAGQLGRMTLLARHMRALHSPALAEWQRLVGPQLYARFIRQEGEAVLWDHPGAGPADEVEARLKAEFGIEVEMLGPTELQKMSPGISSKVRRGMAHTVSPAQLNAALAALMEREGVRFIRERVLKLIRDGRRLACPDVNGQPSRPRDRGRLWRLVCRVDRASGGQGAA